MRDWTGAIIGVSLIAVLASPALAETRRYCVVCTEPDRTYVCQVDTQHSQAVDKGLQLYCIVRTSKDGGHKSCAIDTRSAANCSGPVKAYTFTAPAIPENVQSAIERFRKRSQINKPDNTLPPQKGGEPETLVDMTSRAGSAAREGLRNTGQAVGGAASTTTETVGKAARGVGKGVSNVAGKVGSATKKTGDAVGSAARTAYDCVLSLFRECGGADEAQ